MKSQMKKIKIQVPSPVESPQVWRNGCLKVCSVPFFPSDDNVLENLKKGRNKSLKKKKWNYLRLEIKFSEIICKRFIPSFFNLLTYLASNVVPEPAIKNTHTVNIIFNSIFIKCPLLLFKEEKINNIIISDSNQCFSFACCVSNN